jgi:ribosomal protein S18 acetylase RimI-like enzyme
MGWHGTPTQRPHASPTDTCETEGNAAELSVFAPGGDLETLEELIAWGEARAAAGPRDNLDVPAWPGCGLPEPWILARGYRVSHVMHDMLRPAGAPPPAPRTPLPKGWRWRDVDEELVAAYYDTVRAAFAGLPSAFIPDPASFRARALAQEPPAQLLVEGAPGETPRVAAFVRVDVSDDDTGILAALGRHPRHRGRGLGEHLVAHGLTLLAPDGARPCRLEVAARNHQAIALYESFGFATTTTMPVYRRAAR